MKTPLNIKIMVDDSLLSPQEQIQLRYWIEDAVFSKFGRSPCHSYTTKDGTTYDYAVDWVSDIKIIRELETGKFLADRNGHHIVVNKDGHDIPDPRHHYAPNESNYGEWQCVNCGAMTGSAEYLACRDRVAE